MPKTRLVKAITTKASIESLWAVAEANGEATIYTATEHACVLIRNKLYNHRSKARKSNARHMGVEASSLDRFTITYSHDPDRVKDPWRLTITDQDIVEFTIEIDDDETPSIHFDTLDPDTDVPQAPPGTITPDPQADFDLELGDSAYEEFLKHRG